MDEIEKSYAIGAGVCGIIILLCGIGNTVMGVLWILKLIEWKLEKNSYLYGSGLYSGVPLIITGILGIMVWPKKRRGLMVGFLVMCIISCFFATIQAGTAGAGFSILAVGNCYKSGSDCDKDEVLKFISTSILVWLVMSGLGALLTLAGSIVGCASTCCASRSASGGTVVEPVPMHSYGGPAN